MENFEKILQSLKEEDIFNRIFEIKTKEIILNNLQEKYLQFKKQKLIFIDDKILGKSAIFNLSRANRPQPLNETENQKEDPFCKYMTETPIDEIGRLENEFSVTASNLSKMADYHSLVIFKKHNFQDVNEKDFISSISLAKEWFENIKKFDPEIKNRILIWNYHFRSGASILHPHFQLLAYKYNPVVITDLKRKLENYQKNFTTDYFQDYFNLMKKINLAKEENNIKAWVSLTPEKEKGVNFYGNLFENSKFLWEIIKNLIQTGTQSFNFFYILDLNYGFFVDRGEVKKLNSDFGSLEIFGIKIISSDPTELARAIFKN
jgi:ATP adenylyltransferase/5',5'''-P-1,P-4-tetraphosphate phosphorylase II